MEKNYKGIIIYPDSKIREAIKIIDNNTYYNMAVVLEHSGKFLGIITNGDITRAMLSGASLEDPVSGVMNTQALTLQQEDSQNYNLKEETVRDLLKRKGVFIPILDEERRLVNLIHYLDLELNIDNAGSKFSHRSILVIGGAGYLGNVLIKKLLTKGYSVICLDNFTHDNYVICDLAKTNPNFKIVKADMRNISYVVRTLEEVNAVVHLAAVVGDPACSLRPRDTLEINYLATKMVAEAAKYSQINRFIFASTCSIYGKSENISQETSPLSPVSFYAASKLKSEEGILSILDDRFSPTILRMATLFGLSNRMRFDLVVNTFIMQAVTQGQINIYGGDQWRPFLHVSDAANAFILTLEAPIEKVKGQIYNVGSEKLNYQIRQLGEIIKSALPLTQIQIKEDSKDARNYRVSFKKIQQELSFKETLNINDAILEIKNFIVNNNIDVKKPIYSNSTLDYDYNNDAELNNVSAI